MLNSVNFVWDQRSDWWEQTFKDYKTFKENYKRYPSEESKEILESSLGKWAGHQRQDKKKNKSWRDFDDEDDIIAHYGGDPHKDIDLLIEKNRYNAPTTIKMKFNGEHSEFTEAPPE